MYTESRPAVVPGATASTPELWAEMFARSGRLTKWREMRSSALNSTPRPLHRLR